MIIFYAVILELKIWPIIIGAHKIDRFSILILAMVIANFKVLYQFCKV